MSAETIEEQHPEGAASPWALKRRRVVSRFDILQFTASVTNTRVTDLCGARRLRDLVEKRAIYCVVCREEGYSYPQIGRNLGDRDHTTIMHAERRFSDYAMEDDQLNVWLEGVRARVRAKRSEVQSRLENGGGNAAFGAR